MRPPDAPFRVRRWHEATLAAAGSLLLALLSIEAWDLSLSIPFVHYRDSLYYQMLVKDIIEHGWALTNPSLGAPFETQLYDRPDSDNLNFLIIKAAGVVFSDSAVLINLFWLLTFPATAVAAWAVLRSAGLAASPAVLCAVLFSLLPYHFSRAEQHLFLSAYYSVPLGCYLVLRVLAGKPLFERRRSSESRLWGALSSRRSLGTIVICLVIASAGVYYAVLTGLMVAGAVVVTLGAPNRKLVLAGLAAVALIVGGLLANLSPKFLYEAEHGDNPMALQRFPVDSEVYGLSFTRLMLPATNHRFGPFADEKAYFLDETTIPSEDAQALGLVAGAGFLWLLFLLAAAAIGRSPPGIKSVEKNAAVAAGLAFLIGTVGGGGSAFAYAVTPEIRSWNRISVFIAFFALLAVGFLLQRALGHLQGSRLRRIGAVALLTVVLGLAVYDQTPSSPPYQGSEELLAREYESDERFVTRVEESLPPGAAVFQLPYLVFPEAPDLPGRMTDYEPMKGYLHSRDLRWSYGAMKGRAADLSACVSDLSPERLLPALVAAGFSAVWIDRFGYDAVTGPALQRSIARLVRAAPMTSDDDRYAAFPLAGLETSTSELSRLRAALPDDGDALADCESVRGDLRAALAS